MFIMGMMLINEKYMGKDYTLVQFVKMVEVTIDRGA